MASKRLNNNIRTAIINKVVSETFEERNKRLEEDKGHLFEFIIESLLPDSFATVVTMEGVDDTWFPVITTMDIYDGYDHLTRLGGGRTIVPNYMANYGGHGMTVNIDKLGKMPKEAVKAYLVDRDKLTGDKKKLRESIKEVVKSVTTVKKLLDIWPEASNYLPEKDKPMLPANVNPAELNELIQAMAA